VVRLAAALVLSLRQIEEPVGDIDLIERNVDIVGISGLGKDLVGKNSHRGFLQSVCLRRLTAIRMSRGRRRPTGEVWMSKIPVLLVKKALTCSPEPQSYMGLSMLSLGLSAMLCGMTDDRFDRAVRNCQHWWSNSAELPS
jgi:hypothetical protein